MKYLIAIICILISVASIGGCIEVSKKISGTYYGTHQYEHIINITQGLGWFAFLTFVSGVVITLWDNKR